VYVHVHRYGKIYVLRLRRQTTNKHLWPGRYYDDDRARRPPWTTLFVFQFPNSRYSLYNPFFLLAIPFFLSHLPCQQQSQRLTQKKKKTKCNDLLTHRTIKENPRNMDATQNHTPAIKPNPIKHPKQKKRTMSVILPTTENLAERINKAGQNDSYDKISCIEADG
jgi:hypothetical protein